MNKQELVDAIHGKANADGNGGEISKKDVGRILDASVDVIKETVTSGAKLPVPGLGIFERRDVAARTARNPRTGETFETPATRKVAFKAAAGFKKDVAAA